MDIVLGLIAAAVVALLWNRPWIRPGRLLVGALATATGISSAAWPVVLVGVVLLILAVNPERLSKSRDDAP